MTPGNPALAAVAVFVAYMVLVGVLWRVTGTRYDHLVDSRSTILRGIILPIGLGAVLLAVATTWFGWWEPALVPGATGPSWALIVPLMFGLVAILNIATIDWRSAKARLLPLLLVGTVLVGFAEELATRGQLVVGLRESGSSEVAVWLITSVLFALLHGMNVLFGQSGRATVTQILAAFFAGTALYVTLLTTGSLIVGMVLHALWDFGALGILATGREQRPVAGILGLATFLVAAAAVGFVIAAA
jgi:membrane protease YdiL (CAAX protease family)